MANTFELISSSTVGSGGSSSITFSSIPNTYTDLVVKLSARTADTGLVFDGVLLTFNGATSAFSYKLLYGGYPSSNSVASSGGSSVANITGQYGSTNLATSNTFGSAEIYIPNYASSNYKSTSGDSVAENNGSANIVSLNSGLWSSTSAITSIRLVTNSAFNFVQYTTAYLYGVKSS
jgi:hypothetical protein